MKTKKTQKLFSLLFILLLSSAAYSQYAEINTTFGTNGYARFSDGINDANVCIATGPDESVYVGGETKVTDANSNSKFCVTKYFSNGTIDQSFGTNGMLKGFKYSDRNEVADIYPLNDNIILVLVNTSASTYPDYYAPILYRFRNGVLDNSFNSSSSTPGSVTLDTISYGRKYAKILVDEITGSIYIGGTSLSNSNFKVHKLNADGSKSTNFGTSGVYTAAIFTGSLSDIKFAPQGSRNYLVMSSGTGGGNFIVGMIDETGALNTSFGSGTGYVNIPVAGFYTDQSKSIAVQEDGKILIGGYAQKSNYTNDFAVVRINSDGTIDTGFGTGGTGIKKINAIPGRNNNIKKISLQPDGKILIAGDASSLGPPIQASSILMRLNTDGSTDKITPTDTMFVFETNREIRAAQLYNGGIYITTGSIDVSADESVVLKLKAFPPVEYGLFGKDYISVNKTATFTIDPIKAGYTYIWSYSSDSVFFLGQPTGSSITISFAEFSPSGILTCIITDKAGNQVASLQKNITVNQSPSIADLLADLTCKRQSISCDSNYINQFNILKTGINNANTGCSKQSGGYRDFTFSDYTDTLYLGDRYNIQITTGGFYNKGNYAGIWIDFNNDGDFEDGGEFKNTYFSSDSVISINNFIIDNNSDYAGPKRLRVRMRHAKEFTSSESCPTAVENGEIEDYLVLIDSHQKLQATNFITPNFDGQNDYFVIRGLDPPSTENGVSNEIKIYNRFGELVYNTANYANDFGGSSTSGEVLKNGTYYYVLTQKYKVANEEQEDFLKGFFELKR